MVTLSMKEALTKTLAILWNAGDAERAAAAGKTTDTSFRAFDEDLEQTTKTGNDVINKTSEDPALEAPMSEPVKKVSHKIKGHTSPTILIKDPTLGLLSPRDEARRKDDEWNKTATKNKMRVVKNDRHHHSHSFRGSAMGHRSGREGVVR